MTPRIIYCYDAYCGWCYGFSPVIKTIYEKYKDQFEFETISGGMIPVESTQHIGVIANYILDAYKTVENMFVYLQILSACFVAFAHGANDVANAIGPVAAVLDIIKNGAISDVATVPSWLLAFGGIGIVVGLATWGWRVIETIGKKITELTPTRGFCAEFGAATTILLASKCGLPISTTHCLVGAVLGVGLARGIRALNLGMIKDIVLSWIITIPASAVMSILVFYGLKTLFSYMNVL
jgi:PiT family inorganic phosphate transporter/sodium-dependent phosphate transporter